MQYLQIEDNFKNYQHIQSVLKQGQLETEKPFVSIVITTYKRPNTLKEALESALNQQSFDDYEVIVVDNEVEENTETEKLLHGYAESRLLYYKNQENLGMVGNWNRGIELARGQWVTILHDDDMLFPEFLKKMTAVIKSNQQIQMLIPGVKTGKSIRRLSSGLNLGYRKIKLARFLLGNVSPAPGIMFKKENAIRLGGFNARAYPVMDYVFWINYNMRYGSHFLWTTLAFYRLGDLNESSSVYKDIIIHSYKVKRELLDYINTSSMLKKILFNLGMKNIISAYQKYYSQNEFIELKGEYGIKTGYHSILIRKSLNVIMNLFL